MYIDEIRLGGTPDSLIVRVVYEDGYSQYRLLNVRRVFSKDIDESYTSGANLTREGIEWPDGTTISTESVVQISTPTRRPSATSVTNQYVDIVKAHRDWNENFRQAGPRSFKFKKP